VSFGSVEGAPPAGLGRRFSDLREGAGEGFVTEAGRQPRPLLLAETRGDRRTVEVLKRPAARLGADELEAVEFAQDAHVVADIAERLPERIGELARARIAGVRQALQDPHAQAVREGFGEPLV
jgi:hypothetical protein